jgi:hypothetical protein
MRISADWYKRLVSNYLSLFEVRRRSRMRLIAR